MRRLLDAYSLSPRLVPSVGALVVLALFWGCETQDRRAMRYEVTPLYSATSPTFRQAAGSLLGSGFVPGNNILTLVNGREIFPAMLSAIHSARQSVDLESYIYWD